jgi:hypothetical protein
MAKNKTLETIGLIALLIGLFAVLIGGVGSFSLFFGDSQSFSLTDSTVWLPQYMTASCNARADNGAERDITTHNDDPKFYSCTTSEAKKYVPLINGVQCEYELTDFSNANIYICDVKYDIQNNIISGIPTSPEDSRCVKKSGTFEITSETLRYSVNSGDFIYINSDKIIGDAKLTVKYPSYGLVVETAQGQDLATTNSCEIRSLSNVELHTLNKEDRLFIIPDVPMNAVAGLSPAVSKYVISIQGVNSGEPLYITRPNYYYKIVEAEDGFKYVDTESGERFSSEIQCLPATLGCSDDAKVIKIIDTPCDAIGGAITGYAPIQGDNSQLCKYECKNNINVVSNNCISVRTEPCPTETPLWDTNTGKCTAIEDIIEKSDEDTDFTPLYVLIGGVVVMIIGASIQRRKK